MRIININIMIDNDINSPYNEKNNRNIEEIIELFSKFYYIEDFKEILKNTTVGNKFIFGHSIFNFFYNNLYHSPTYQCLGETFHSCITELQNVNLYKKYINDVRYGYSSLDNQFKLFKELSKLFKYAMKGTYFNGNFKINNSDFEDRNTVKSKIKHIYPTEQTLKNFELLVAPIMVMLKKDNFSNFLNLLIDYNSIIYSKKENNTIPEEYYKQYNINTFIKHLADNKVLYNQDGNGIYRNINIEKFEVAFQSYYKMFLREKNKNKINVINRINNICNNDSNSNTNKMNDSIPQLNENATRLFKKILDNNSNCNFNIENVNFKKITPDKKNILGNKGNEIYNIIFLDNNKFYLEFNKDSSAFYIGTNDTKREIDDKNPDKIPVENVFVNNTYNYTDNSKKCKGFIIVDSNIKQKYNNKEVIYVGGANYYMNYKKTWGNKNDFFDIINSDKAHVGCYSSDYENRFDEHINIVTGNSTKNTNNSKNESKLLSSKKESNKEIEQKNNKNSNDVISYINSIPQNHNGKLILKKIDKNNEQCGNIGNTLEEDIKKDNLSKEKKEDNINSSSNIKTIKVKTKKELENSKKDDDKKNQTTQNIMEDLFDQKIGDNDNKLISNLGNFFIKKESHLSECDNDNNKNNDNISNIEDKKFFKNDANNSHNDEKDLVNYFYYINNLNLDNNTHNNKFLPINNKNIVVEEVIEGDNANNNINNISKNGEELQKTNEQNTKLDDRNNNEDKFEPIQHTTISKRTDINKNNNKSSTFINSKFLHNENIQHNNDKSETNNDIKEINENKDNNKIPAFLEGFNDNIQHNNDKSETNNNIQNIDYKKIFRNCAILSAIFKKYNPQNNSSNKQIQIGYINEHK